MDDRLTYKIGEKEGVALRFMALSVDRVKEALCDFSEKLLELTGANFDSIVLEVVSLLRNTPRKPLPRSVRKITPTHAAPVRPIQYRARSRC